MNPRLAGGGLGLRFDLAGQGICDLARFGLESGWGELGLFGFVFWGGAEGHIVVTRWDITGCCSSLRAGIGFVLHNQCLDG